MAKSSTSFKPGETGNKNGRPRGVREKITAAFEQAILKDMKRSPGEEHQPETNLDAAIAKMRQDRPSEYGRLLQAFAPKIMQYDGKMDHRHSLDDPFVKMLEQLGKRKALEPRTIDITPSPATNPVNAEPVEQEAQNSKG